MRGNVVHRWQLPFRQAWPQTPHINRPLADDRIHWVCARLCPNGDLLAIYHADNAHHDVEIGEDGAIYTLTHEIVRETPAGMRKFLSGPLLADSLVVLSPEGRERERISLLEAFRDSPYVLMLASVTKQSVTEDDAPVPVVSPSDSAASNDRPRKFPWRKDLLHANSVRVLPRALASKFPLFKPGQVLISLRNLDALVVVDRHSRSVVWASNGIWLAQHDAEFLENGHLLLYDNLGSLGTGTRVLEYDPLTQAIPWFYVNDHAAPFRALIRGMKQRLPNGNTLIVDPDHQRLLEVTLEREVVWECYCPSFPVLQGQPRRARIITSARRYRADELTFLKGVARARP